MHILYRTHYRIYSVCALSLYYVTPQKHVSRVAEGGGFLPEAREGVQQAAWPDVLLGVLLGDWRESLPSSRVLGAAA